MLHVIRLQLWLGALVLLAGLGLSEGLRAQPQPTSDPGAAYDLGDDYLIRTWTTSEGLPANFVSRLYQTSDGYLWLGSGGRLTRFDGARFRVFTPGELGWSRVFMKGLHEDTTGTLWALSANDELVRIKGGQVLRPPPEVMPDPPEPFFRDEAGHVWLRTEDESVRVGGDTVIGFGAKWLPQRHPLKIAFDLEGRSWAATGDSVYR